MTAERVTVNLIDKASTALNDACVLTGDNKTDTINRALQLYAWVQLELRKGGELILRSTDGELERIHLL
ncbi:MAG TPA: hypothetical protein VD834_16545 [Blastococcus sp.]|nr:hypothetical protein [Nocardioides sp.]HYH26956.1 hypothetical protein [Blastococcus sp.]